MGIKSVVTGFRGSPNFLQCSGKEKNFATSAQNKANLFRGRFFDREGREEGVRLGPATETLIWQQKFSLFT